MKIMNYLFEKKRIHTGENEEKKKHFLYNIHYRETIQIDRKI